ncbi:helix-turn-helix domain-containing protein [Polaromonas sp. DSR2-3-2]|uniref:helix-turn-helix domain-containing protein n=1 Tax=unclassified Polaromonas TaxID=2638319 RepID=UPI003CEFE08A
MSISALTWALNEPIKQSSMKFVLVVFANCANDKTSTAWPSAVYVAEATAQDRKTVQANVKRLVELGYITDTGERKGRTKQVIVYRLNYPGFGPVQEDQKRVSSKKPDFPFEEAHFSSETGPKTGHGTQRIPKEPDTPPTPHGGPARV